MSDQPVMLGDESLFLPEETPAQDLFVKEPTASTPPPNSEELAAQLALADDMDFTSSFEERYRRHRTDVDMNGPRESLDKVARQERDQQVSTLTQMAEQASLAGSTLGLEAAVKQIAAFKSMQQPSRMEGLRATAERALELEGFKFAAPKYRNMEVFADKVESTAEAVSIRNLAAMVSAEMGEPSMWDKISHFFGEVLLSPVYEWKAQGAINRAIGSDALRSPLTSFGSVEDLRRFFLQLDGEERVSVMRALAKEELGIFGGNKAANVELLRKLVQMTGSDAIVDTAFNALTVADAAQITKLLANVVRRGTPLKALNDVAGEEAAAKVAVNDLVSGSRVGGLNDADLMARMLSVGKNPLDVDPAAFAGMSAAAQAELRAAWDGLLKQTQDRLISSGLTADEIKQGLADIKARYSVETNKAIHSVIFGEGDELGQKMTVYWQTPDGHAFSSKEAADAYAKAEGMVEFAVVPKNAAIRRSISLDDVDSFLDSNPEQVAGTVRQLDFDINGTHFGEGIDEPTRKLFNSWAADLGFDSKFVIVTKGDLIKNPRAYADHMDARGPAGIVEMVLKEPKGHGFHVRLGDTNLIIIDEARVAKGGRHWIEVLAHEMGHAFDDEFMHRLWKQEREALVNEFNAWRSKTKGAKQYFTRMAAPGTLEDTSAQWLVKGAKLDGLKKTDPDLHAWVTDYHEWWAEQFARFMLTDAKPVSAIEKFFHEAAQRLKRMYERLVEQFGGYAKDPHKSVQKLLREHLERMKDISDDAFASLEANSELRFKKGSKPNIKLKGDVVAGPTEEWLVMERRTDPISFANVGKFSENDIRSMPWLAIDPKHAASELAVEERVIGVHAEAKTRKDLTGYLTPFFAKLDNAGKRRVMSVLDEGDAFSNPGKDSMGKEFTYAELRGKGLSEAEAEAYFAARHARMMSYHLRNAELTRALRADGYREVEFLGTDLKVAGRVLDRKQANQASLGKTVWDTVKGEAVLVDSSVLDTAYAGGKRVVQLKSPVEFKGKHYFTLMVDDSTAKARDIHTALHYRPGEFSRIYSDQYFITVKKMKEVDGAMVEVTETVRTAASQREAAEYTKAHKAAIELMLKSKTVGVPGNALDRELEKLIGRYTKPAEFKAAFDAGDLEGFTAMDWHYTRNRDEYLNSSLNEAATNGRLFTSKRSDKLFSVDKDRRNTLDVFESLQAEITNISRVANISMWRETMIRRWMNTFGDMVPNRTGNDVADFYSVAGGTFTRGTPEAQFAERTHKYIMRQLGVRTAEEKFWEGLTRTVSEKLFTGNEQIESIGAKIRTMSWLGFLRNVNFNLNLGMFNPAQLLVQANGAATAMILSPLHGLAAAKTFPLLRMALMSDNPAVWRNLARVEKLSSLGLGSEEEFVRLIRAVRKTGILDNMKSTALWNLEDGALDVFAGYPRRAVGTHTFFFNRGEEFSRLVSFDVARREWMAKNPGKDWMTSEVLKHLVVRMDDLTQNMTKANQAFFQTGVLSIPFQFAQYNIKLAANVMTAFVKGGQGRGFSRMEASQLLLGHVLVYGAAGNGLSMLVDEFLGTEGKEQMGVEQKNLIAQGAISWVFDQVNQVLTGEGSKVALGSRLGSFDYYQKIGEAIFKDPKNVYEALLGPTVSSAKRLGVIGEVAQLWWKDPELTGQEVLEGLAKMSAEQVASLRNVTKAYLYHTHQGKMLDRKGVAAGMLNKNELLMQALGFAPTASVDLHNLIQAKSQHGKALDEIAELVFKTQRDIITALNRGDEKGAAQKKQLLQALWPTNAGDMMEVQRRVRDRLFPYDTEMQKLLADYLLKGQTYEKPLVVTQEPRKVNDGR